MSAGTQGKLHQLTQGVLHGLLYQIPENTRFAGKCVTHMWLACVCREFLKEVSDPSSPGAKPKHDSDPTVPTLSQHRPLINTARRLLDEVQSDVLYTLT